MESEHSIFLVIEKCTICSLFVNIAKLLAGAALLTSAYSHSVQFTEWDLLMLQMSK